MSITWRADAGSGCAGRDPDYHDDSKLINVGDSCSGSFPIKLCALATRGGSEGGTGGVLAPPYLYFTDHWRYSTIKF